MVAQSDFISVFMRTNNLSFPFTIIDELMHYLFERLGKFSLKQLMRILAKRFWSCPTKEVFRILIPV